MNKVNDFIKDTREPSSSSSPLPPLARSYTAITGHLEAETASSQILCVPCSWISNEKQISIISKLLSLGSRYM